MRSGIKFERSFRIGQIVSVFRTSLLLVISDWWNPTWIFFQTVVQADRTCGGGIDGASIALAAAEGPRSLLVFLGFPVRAK